MSGPAGEAPPKHKLCPTCRRIYPAASNFCPQDQTALVASDQIIAGRYILVRMVGAGAMGKVYMAEDTQLGRQVALKLLNPAKDAHLRIDREAKAVGALDHDNVVRVYERGQADDGRVYIAMEYLEGESLRQFLATHGQLPMKQALDLWLQAVRGVAAAHKKNVVHRDLKPDNLFLARREQDDRTIEQLKVLDFGIAQLHNDRPTPTRGTMRIGTPGYVAPEQWMHGEATTRSDVYSLGVILLEMLTGRRTMAANPAATREAFELFALKQRLSPALNQLAADVLSPDPAVRPENARVLLDRLRTLPESHLWMGDAGNPPRESPPPVSTSAKDDLAPRATRSSSEDLLPLSDDEEDADTEQVSIESLAAPRPLLTPVSPEVERRLKVLDQPTLRVELPGQILAPRPARPPVLPLDRTRIPTVARPPEPAPPPPPAPPTLDPGPTQVTDQMQAQVVAVVSIEDEDQTARHGLPTAAELELLPDQQTFVLANAANLATVNLLALPPLPQQETQITPPDASRQSPVRRSSKDAQTVMSPRSHVQTVTNGVAPTMPLGMSASDLWPQQPKPVQRLLTFLRAPTALGPVAGVLLLCALLGMLASAVIIWFLHSPG